MTHNISLRKKCLIRSFSAPYFPVFELNAEIYGESSHISSNVEKNGLEKLRVSTLPTQCFLRYLANGVCLIARMRNCDCTTED